MAGVEYQVTKVDPTDPETKGMVYQVHKVSEEVAATLGGKVYRARIVKNPSATDVAGKVYQIVLIGDPDDPEVKGKVYNAIITGDGTATVITPAVPPITLEDGVESSLVALTAYGKCENRTLPAPYVEYDYIVGDGLAYIDLNLTLDQDDEIEIDFAKAEGAVSRNIFGGRSAAQTNNISVILAGSGNVVADFNNSDYTPYRVNVAISANTMYKVIVNKTGRYVYNASGTLIDSNTTECTDTITTPGCYLFNLAGTGLGAKFSGKVYKCVVKGKRDCVPAYNGTEYGMYDRLNGVFYGNVHTEGEFTAGSAVSTTPTPTTPVDIWCNNGAIKFSPNEANYVADNVTLGYWLRNSDGQPESSPANFYTAMMPVKPNTSYVCFGRKKDTNVISGYNRIAWYDANGVWIRNSTYTVNTPGIDVSPSNAAFARFHCNPSGVMVTQELLDSYNWVFQRGTAEVPYIPYEPVNPYIEGITETIATKADGETISTATCENLFGVGDYADEQEAIAGNITRKVGVKVLDGTETWSQSGNLFYADIANDALQDTHTCICTHFVGIATNASATYEDKIKVGTNLTASSFWARVQVYPVVGTFADATAFKTWLTQQYAAGTPVIVVYPLKTSITETVTGQDMEIVDGDNTVEITQASLDDLEVGLTYMKEEA